MNLQLARAGVMSGNNQTNGVYLFGGFRLDPARRLLTRANGEPVPVTGKPFDALLCLVERAGTVVSRRELAQALWPSTVVEDNNLSQTVLALRRALGDTQAEPRFIATVPRRGYQFVADVRQTEPRPAADAAPALARRVPAVSWLLGVAAIAAAMAWYALQGGGGAEPGEVAANTPASRSAQNAPPNSIAVLPFQNVSPREENAYFAVGMHEEVVSQLARVRGIEVKGRTSVLSYGDGRLPVETIVRELGVATVLEGSVRYAAERVRVSVRLVDGASGMELWGETYDAALGDVFAIQADIAARIATELATELTPAEVSSLATAPTGSLEAYALYMQAIALYRTHGGIGVSMPSELREAMTRRLDDALGLDPDFAAPLGWRGHILLDSLMFDRLPESEWSQRSAGLIRGIERDAARALEVDPAQGMAHVTLARLDMYRWRLPEARAKLERARELRSSDAVIEHYIGMISIMLGEHHEAVRAARRALELDPGNPAPYTPLSIALRALGDREGAITACREMIEVAPNAPIGYINLARTQADGADREAILGALRLAERFLDDSNNFRADAALSYARAGAHADAERLIAAFERANAGRHIGPGLAAMARLAVRDYAAARRLLEQAIQGRTQGMDPVPLVLISRNTWADPVLEEAEWRMLRARLAYDAKPDSVTARGAMR